MVRVLCLDDDDPDEPDLNNESPATHPVEETRPDPNLHHRFSAALGCYPIVSQLATSLDLTSLYDLSLACRRFRVNLLPYRRQLIALALRCDNESIDAAKRLAAAYSASLYTWRAFGRQDNKVPRLTNGKIGPCARDLVGECRKCSRVVCRNCIMKPPPSKQLQGRHRRLCRACLKVPLSELSGFADTSLPEKGSISDVTTTRGPCTCVGSVWICSSCGTGAKSDDTTYMRGWSWRTRYSTCGGFGAGLGEGVEGVECGRGVRCQAATTVEKEVECDAGELALIEAEAEKARSQGRAWAGNSYTTHEMVGIGGQVKVKVKKMVVVGATVREHEDERGSGDYLHLERAGHDRSWCSWCDRVIPSKSDLYK